MDHLYVHVTSGHDMNLKRMEGIWSTQEVMKKKTSMKDKINSTQTWKQTMKVSLDNVK